MTFRLYFRHLQSVHATPRIIRRHYVSVINSTQRATRRHVIDTTGQFTRSRGSAKSNKPSSLEPHGTDWKTDHMWNSQGEDRNAQGHWSLEWLLFYNANNFYVYNLRSTFYQLPFEWSVRAVCVSVCLRGNFRK